MARSKEQQRAYNRRMQAEYRARKKLEVSGQPAQTVEQPVEPDEAALEIDVIATEQPVKKLSLKERLFGQHKAVATPEPAKKPASRKKGDNLISTVLPTVVAGFVATYARQILPEEYRRCAPSSEEVSAILAPLMRIIGRRVEIYGKASQDVLDITNSVISAFAYGTRAYITYVDIKHEHEEPGYGDRRAREYKEQLDREAREYRERLDEARAKHVTVGHLIIGDYQNSVARATGHSGGSAQPGAGAINDSNGDANTDGIGQENASGEAALFADMLRRDKQGRVKLGLLAG